MADFTSDLQSFKPSFPFLEIDPNMDLMSQFSSVLHPSLMEASSNMNNNLQSLMEFSQENFFNPQQQQQSIGFPGNLLEHFPGIFHHDEEQKNVIPIVQPAALSSGNEVSFVTESENKKRKALVISECSSGNSSTPGSENGIDRKNSSGKGKKIRGNDMKNGMPKDVVHVRARRGQATDSHSLAERVRRGKINERLRCLQDIVPGCYKTMGMAVMLDEIINYVQSLQNQVDFLSMKLTAASSFYDFNSETDAVQALQRAKANEAQKIQRVMRGYEEVGSTQVGPLDLTFGSYPSLPYNTL